MKRINNFSGGLCSFWSAWRDVQEFGSANVVLLFADTLIESPGLYQFLADASNLLGVPVTRVSRELTPWQLFRQQKMIGNNRFPICSVYLKRELLDAWMVGNFEMDRFQESFLEKASLSVGFDWSEEHRTNNLRAVHPTWEIRAPMQLAPIWDKCKMQVEAEKLGLRLSDAYKKDGLPHDNYGGGCVRAGIAHWAHILRVRPKVFTEWETEEWETAEYLRREGIEPLSMLKDRRGGETKNLYLRDLRERIEAGEAFDKHDWGGCGCGGATIGNPRQ
jgi:hypothetical protein